MNEARDAFVVPTSVAEGRDEQGPTAQVRQLRTAIPLRPVTPQCEANRTNRYLSDEYGAGRTRPLPQCSHSSSYVINGAHYCKRHAGDVALKLLLEQSAAKVEGSVAGPRYSVSLHGVSATGSDAPKPPCSVCGLPYAKHGSYPTCASHPYAAGGEG